jgi:hypothetical protein
MRALFLCRFAINISIGMTLASGLMAYIKGRRSEPPFDIEKARQYWRTQPEPERSAVYLHVDHGLTYLQIAEHLGITPEAALQAVSKGYGQLRMRLRDMASDEFNLTLQTPPAMTDPLPIRIFQIHDTEWWAGRTMQEVVDAAAKAWGFEVGSDDYRMMTEEAIELTDETMDRLQFSYDDDNAALKRTFRDELDLRIADPTNTFPQFFAGVE